MLTPRLEEGHGARSYEPTITSWLSSVHNTPRSMGYEADKDDYFKPITKGEEKNIEMLLLRRRSTKTVTRAQLALNATRSRPPMQSNKRSYGGFPPTGAECIVDWENEHDTDNPLNWIFRKKVVCTMLYALTTFGASFASAVYSSGADKVSKEFDIPIEIGRLGTSLLMFGFGVGPLLWGNMVMKLTENAAPLSELYGRKYTVLGPYSIAMVFAFSTGAAKDIQTVLITRFFTGFFASAPVCITGGVLKDIWPSKERGVALVFYGLSVLSGPLLAPLIGGAIVQSSLGWRWTAYMTGIWMLMMCLLDYTLLDESFAPILLTRKARLLRNETSNYALHAKHEEAVADSQELAHKYLVRPFQMIATPILFCIALYSSFVYGILYANLGAFQVVYQEGRKWDKVKGGLPFLSIFLGVLFGAVANVGNQGYFSRKMQQNNNKPLPEARLPPMMAGSVFFAAGLFIFAWTSSPHIHWAYSQIGAAFVGFGFFTIIQPGMNYVVDTFGGSSASAVAAMTFLRSMTAGGLPLGIVPLLSKLGVPWGISVFGFFAIALVPIPFLFFIFGKKIRAKGKWSRDSVEGLNKEESSE